MSSYIKKTESDIIKKQMLDLYNKNEDWRSFAKGLGVMKSTAYRWVRQREMPEKKHSGGPKPKITDTHRSFMERCIEANPRITLQQMIDKLQTDLAFVVTKECLRRHIDGLLYTLRDFETDPTIVNSEDNKIMRSDYVQKLLEHQSDNRPILYMNATNFHLYISGKKDRSKSRSRCTYISAGSRRSNIHIIGCMGRSGLIDHELTRGAFKESEVKEFGRRCLRNLKKVYHTPIVIIIDSDVCHTAIQEVFQEDEFASNYLLKMPPYSLMLNAMEYALTNLKSRIKNDFSIQFPQILVEEETSDLTQKEFRLQRLEQIIRENIATYFTIANCSQHIDYIQTFLQDAIDMKDMNFEQPLMFLMF